MVEVKSFVQKQLTVFHKVT